MSQITRRELMPGVWLRTIHTEQFKSSYLALTMMLPLQADTASANALIPYVLRRGTSVHPDLEALSAALDQLYGGAIEPVVRKKGETQCVGFVASFLDDAYTLQGEAVLEPAAQLLGELLLSPFQENGHFSTHYTTSEQTNLVDRIRSQINDKRRYAVSRLGELMCAGEAFGVDKLGDETSAGAITPESLWKHYQQLLECAEIEVYYCGSAQPERVERALSAALSKLPKHVNRISPECEITIHAPQKPRLEVEPMDVAQGKLSLGFRTGGITCWEEEFPALVLCNAIFGGSTLSKLFLNVREKHSLCYYASSVLEKMKGLILVSSGIEFEKYQQAKDEILAQLDAIRQGDIEDWGLEGARRSLMGSYRALSDSQSQQEEFWLGQAAAGLESTPQAMAEALESVTREQVAAVAQKLELDTIYFLTGRED